MSPFEHGEVFVLDDGGEVFFPPYLDTYFYKLQFELVMVIEVFNLFFILLVGF